MLVLLDILGFVAITAGVCLVSIPAGVIVGGVLALVLSQLLDGAFTRRPGPGE